MLLTAPAVGGGWLVTFGEVVQAAVAEGSIGVRVTFMPGLSRSSSRILERVWRGLACGVYPAAVIGAEVGEAGAGVGDEDGGDLADDPGHRDDGFLVAAVAGYPAVLRAEAGVGPGRRHRALAERAAQVRVALAGDDRAGTYCL